MTFWASYETLTLSLLTLFIARAIILMELLIIVLDCLPAQSPFWGANDRPYYSFSLSLVDLPLARTTVALIFIFSAHFVR